MTYVEAIEKIHGFSKFGSRLGLERMIRLMELLGNPQDEMKVIHVAGTNGKGSVCRYLTSVLLAQGYHVGLYTSPYLERFTERMEFDGREITEKELVESTQRVLPMVDKMLQEGLDSPTEFELITAIGFDYFSRKKMDYLVLEVGMGGSGDSTNVVGHPLISVITSVSFDHVEQLGSTLEQIATEKSGIIKPGVPVVSNVQSTGAKMVIANVALQKQCSFYDASQNVFSWKKNDLDGICIDIEINDKKYQDVCLSMIGRHQAENAVCAMTALEVLCDYGDIVLDPNSIYIGMKKAKQNGRLEQLRNVPALLIDGAHNTAGAETLLTAMRDYFPNKKILLVLGILRDKEVEQMIGLFQQITKDMIVTEPDNPRKLEANQLGQLLARTGVRYTAIPHIEEACAYVDQVQSGYDAVIFAGSLYLIGKVRSYYEK